MTEAELFTENMTGSEPHGMTVNPGRFYTILLHGAHYLGT